MISSWFSGIKEGVGFGEKPTPQQSNDPIIQIILQTISYTTNVFIPLRHYISSVGIYPNGIGFAIIADANIKSLGDIT